MKKLMITFAMFFALVSSVFAERYVMVTHGEGKDPFWPVVQKGGEDAARAIGADFEYIVCDQFGVWVEISMYGRKYMGIQRATFLCDKKGIITNVWEKVKVPGHADEVLAAVEKLNI